MGFDPFCHECEKENKRLLGIIEVLSQTLLNLTKPKPDKVRLILTNNKNQQIMSLSIVSNQQDAGVLGLLDAVTNTPVSGTFTGTTATSDTPAAFTATTDGASNVNVVGVAPGSGNLTVSTTAAFTDSTGAAQSQVLSVVIPVTVTAVVVADQVTLQVTFGNPSAQ